MCLLLLVTPSAIAIDAIDMPFGPGERLVFELRWGVIPAGEAVLEVLPIEEMNGEPAYHFVMTARTNSFVDVFYKVRDRIDSYTDTDLTHTLFYKKKQREGSTKRNITVQFDWEKKLVQYTKNNRSKDPVPVLPGAFDPLAVFYYSRLIELKSQAEIERPVTDGGKCVIGRAKVIRREKIRVPAGEYDTYLLEPELKHIKGVFEKSNDATIQLWITADNRRMPVKIKSKVVVGSFVGELVKVDQNAHLP